MVFSACRAATLEKPKTPMIFCFIFIHRMKIKQKMVGGNGLEPSTSTMSTPEDYTKRL